MSVVASDIFGVSGRDMTAALIGGQPDLKVLAQLARGRMRAKISDLREAFTGRFSDHHEFLLTKMPARIDAINADLKAKIDEQITPFAHGVARLDAIPGVGVTAAQAIIAEPGRWDALLRPTYLESRACDLSTHTAPSKPQGRCGWRCWLLRLRACSSRRQEAGIERVRVRSGRRRRSW